jgi:DNA-binding MarR family transcriptional regulator
MPNISEYRLDESVGYLLARTNSTVSNMVTQRTSAQLNITGTQGRILFMVASGKCMLTAELARMFGIDASAVTRLIDRLEKRGLLKRIRTIEDRRILRLEVTTEGHAIAMRMPAIFTGVLDELLSGFMPEEVELFKSMLRRALANSGELLGIIRDAAVNSAGFPDQQIAAQPMPRPIHSPRVER